MQHKANHHPIRIARRRARLSQSALGNLVGVSKAAVSKWENQGGLPAPRTAVDLTRVLPITLEQIYGAAQQGREAA